MFLRKSVHECYQNVVKFYFLFTTTVENSLCNDVLKYYSLYFIFVFPEASVLINNVIFIGVMLNSVIQILFSIFHLSKLFTIFVFPEDSIIINDVIFIDVWLIL